MRRSLSLAAVLLAWTISAREARADDWNFDFSPLPPVMLGVPLQLAGAALTGIDIADAAQGERPSGGVLAWSYVVAYLNLGVGGWALAEGLSHELSWVTGLGVSGLALGVAGFGMALLAHAQPKERPVAVVPLLGTDSTGGLVAGVGLQLTRF